MDGALNARRAPAAGIRGAGAAAALTCAGMLVLSACGFRLAGSDHLPPTLARPYLSVKDPYTDFAREFEHGRQDATATIEVTKDLVEQRTLAVSARNIPTDYELTYTVTFAVHGPDAEL